MCYIIPTISYIVVMVPIDYILDPKEKNPQGAFAYYMEKYTQSDNICPIVPNNETPRTRLVSYFKAQNMIPISARDIDTDTKLLHALKKGTRGRGYKIFTDSKKNADNGIRVDESVGEGRVVLFEGGLLYKCTLVREELQIHRFLLDYWERIKTEGLSQGIDQITPGIHNTFKDKIVVDGKEHWRYHIFMEYVRSEPQKLDGPSSQDDMLTCAGIVAQIKLIMRTGFNGKGFEFLHGDLHSSNVMYKRQKAEITLTSTRYNQSYYNTTFKDYMLRYNRRQFSQNFDAWEDRLKRLQIASTTTPMQMRDHRNKLKSVKTAGMLTILEEKHFPPDQELINTNTVPVFIDFGRSNITLLMPGSIGPAYPNPSTNKYSFDSHYTQQTSFDFSVFLVSSYFSDYNGLVLQAQTSEGVPFYKDPPRSSFKSESLYSKFLGLMRAQQDYVSTADRNSSRHNNRRVTNNLTASMSNLRIYSAGAAILMMQGWREYVTDQVRYEDFASEMGARMYTYILNWTRGHPPTRGWQLTDEWRAKMGLHISIHLEAFRTHYYTFYSAFKQNKPSPKVTLPPVNWGFYRSKYRQNNFIVENTPDFIVSLVLFLRKNKSITNFWDTSRNFIGNFVDAQYLQRTYPDPQTLFTIRPPALPPPETVVDEGQEPPRQRPRFGGQADLAKHLSKMSLMHQRRI